LLNSYTCPLKSWPSVVSKINSLTLFEKSINWGKNNQLIITDKHLTNTLVNFSLLKS
jgi:hypothetical protein